MIFMRTLIGSLLLSLSLSGGAGVLPNFKADYKVEAYGAHGNGYQEFHVDKNGHYKYKAVTKGKYVLIPLTIIETSEGEWRGSIPVPHKYRFKVNSSFVTKHREIDFDWKNKVAHANDYGKKKKADIPLKAGMQDVASYQLAMRQAAREGKSNIEFKLIRKNTIRDYAFKKAKNPRFNMKTVAGKIEVLKYLRIKGKHRRTEVYLIPKQDYLLGRIARFKKDKCEAVAQLTNHQSV